MKLKNLLAVLVLTAFTASCDQGAPTAPVDGPLFGKIKECPGHPSCPDGDGGSGTLAVQFWDTAGDVPGNFWSEAQTGRGNSTKKKIDFEDTYRLFLRFGEELGLPDPVCRTGHTPGQGEPDNSLLQFLQDASGSVGLDGELFIRVWKDNPGTVVNFTVTVGGDEYFLTTGGGTATLTEDGGVATVTKNGGFIRVVKGGLHHPEHEIRCEGIVDYSFTAREP